MLYELNNITRTFGDRTVLDIEHLAFEARRIYALIGPNGAGKSTLLNLLSFLDQPSSGEIRFKSKPAVYEQSPLTGLRRQVVMVDQNPIMFSGTVWKNVGYGLKVRKVAKAERVVRIEYALEQVGMSDFARRNIHGLSGGEVKRVALARALALEPEVLMCDEPTAGVDSEHQEIILRILSHANSVKHATVIFSTHYLSQSRRLADRTILLQRGSLATHTEENLFHVRLVKRGETLMSLLGDRYVLPFTDPQSMGRENQRVQIHIDPRQITLAAAGAGDSVTTIPGRVVSISDEKGHVRIVVDVGVSLQVLLDEERFLDNPYQVLQDIDVHIPQQGIQLIP